MNAENNIDEVFWRTFPLDDVPRPLILLDRRVHIEASGFGHDVDAKRAWLSGAVDAEVELPDGVMDILVPDRLSYSGGRMAVTAIERTESAFRTDRGPRDLPAYRVSVTGLVDPCVVLDPTVQPWWPLIGQQPADAGGMDAIVEDDDRTIHFPAYGGALTEFLHAEFDEYPAFVVGHAITTRKILPVGTAVPAIGIHKRVTGRLAHPRGRRVLLNTRGFPLSVQQP